jgi:phospholipid/cholesterol/gamma-HCH transport system substrate-binding protein
MSKSRLEWRVGLFVFIGLALLAALLLQFSKGLTFFRPTDSIILHASSVGGLKIRSYVLMAGVQIGTVSDIQLALGGTNVAITLKIFRQHKIYKDARFTIEQSGFLGDQYVSITPTKNEGGIFHDGDNAAAEPPFNLQEVARAAGGFLQRVDETAKTLNDAIADVRRLVLNEETLTNISVAVTTIRTASERAVTAVDGLNALVASNAPAFAGSGSNLVFFSEQLNAFAKDLSGVLATNEPALSVAVKNIESSSVALNNLFGDVQAGKGLAGKLLKDDDLAESMSQIVNNLSITSSNLNRLGLWGILWKKKAPRANEPTARPLPAPKNPTR